MKTPPILSLALFAFAIVASSQTANAQLTFEFEFTGYGWHATDDAEALSDAQSSAHGKLNDYMDALFFAYGASAISYWVFESETKVERDHTLGSFGSFVWVATYTIRGTIVLWPAGAGL